MNASALPKDDTDLTLEKVEAGSHPRLILLVAPEGSGKTRLLRRWSAELQAASIPVAWLTLQDDHNSSERFWADLKGALNAVIPLDLPIEGKDLEAAITCLVNSLADTSSSLALVLDGYEVIWNEEVHQAVRLILDYPPPDLHLVIASRSEPPLQIPRLRLRRQLVEVRFDTQRNGTV